MDVPRKGNVDRNTPRYFAIVCAMVDVPRKGNVDRNVGNGRGYHLRHVTFPARGTWIEITLRARAYYQKPDVPRKGNVDRNNNDDAAIDEAKNDVPRKGNVDRNIA